METRTGLSPSLRGLFELEQLWFVLFFFSLFFCQTVFFEWWCNRFSSQVCSGNESCDNSWGFLLTIQANVSGLPPIPFDDLLNIMRAPSCVHCRSTHIKMVFNAHETNNRQIKAITPCCTPTFVQQTGAVMTCLIVLWLLTSFKGKEAINGCWGFLTIGDLLTSCASSVRRYRTTSLWSGKLLLIKLLKANQLHLLLVRQTFYYDRWLF